MRRIEKFEDVLESREFNFEEHYNLSGDLLDVLKAQGVTFIPCDNPVGGEFGVMAYKEEHDMTEKTMMFSSKVFDKAEHIHHDDFALFKTRVEDAIDVDLPLLKCDDPKRLLIGVLILRNSGNQWHTVGLNALKLWQSMEGE